MDQRSPMEMIYLAVEYLLIGAFLVMGTYAISLRNDFAETRNSLLESEENVRQYREFNAYNIGECTGVGCTGHIYGDEVIELVRRYYDLSGVEIYIDKTGGSGTSLTVNTSNVLLNPDTYSLANLQTLFDSKAEFHPFLVYNGVSPSSISTYQNGIYGTVTGISVIWQTDNNVVVAP